MWIGLAYNVKHEETGREMGKLVELDFDSWEVIEGLKKTLERLGHTVAMVKADEEAFDKLRNLKGKVDIVFNIAEGLHGDAREAQVPLVCEILGLAYTHSGPTTHAVKLDKHMAKLAVKGAGVKVPEGFVVRHAEVPELPEVKMPVIVKPNAQGSSIGVFDTNVVKEKEKLAGVIKEVSKGGKWEVVVEEYIEGREFTVSLLGNDPVEVLPIIEQKFGFLPPGMNRIAGYEVKWIYETQLADITEAYSCPADIDRDLREEIEKTSVNIFKSLNVKDCARIDFRLDERDNLYFLEINTLPGLNPDPAGPSYFVYAAFKAGMTYEQLVERILLEGCRRWGLTEKGL